MSLVRITATVGASLAVAIGLGVAFQPDAPEVALRPAAPPPAPSAVSASLTALPTLSSGSGARAEQPAQTEQVTPARHAIPTIAALTEASPALEPAREPALGRTASDDGRAADAATDADACALRAEVFSQPAAMLALSIHAPCDIGEPLAISHGGLLMAEAVGTDGRLDLAVPALAREATLTIAALDGRVLQVTTQVPDFDLYQRVMLHWDGAPVLDLHAFAGGAGWGEPGHVRAGGPVSAATGFILAFGDPELEGPRAWVYTYPVGIAATSGHVTLEAQIAVVDPVCGRRFEAEVLGHVGGPRLLRRAVSVEVPACGGPGGMVLLPDLIPMGSIPDLAALD